MAEEKSFENRIKKWLKDHNCYHVKFFANSRTKIGVPDILASVNGYFVGIEVKSTNGKPSELQLYNIREIRKSGGYAWVVYPSGWETLEKYLLNMLSGLVYPIGIFNENKKEVLK